MKFIINDLKYDTDKMEKIADVKKWYPTNNALIRAVYKELKDQKIDITRCLLTKNTEKHI